ncbi:MAG: TonB-dependent receptor [Oxalobacteraceae bacterium]|nr:TonB-dependent receptor [Oxalobacteraceae bacterium]
MPTRCVMAHHRRSAKYSVHRVHQRIAALRLTQAACVVNRKCLVCMGRIHGKSHAGNGTDRPRESFSYRSLNPSLGLSHKLNNAVTVFGNVGQSNRVPTVIELGCADPAEPCRLPTGLQADPYLKQVIARTVEIGSRWRDGDTELTASLYRSENADDILFRAVDNTGRGGEL